MTKVVKLYTADELTTKYLWSKVWKQAAKKWREKHFIEDCAHAHTAQYTKEYSDTADRRLELLREIGEWYRETCGGQYRFIPTELLEKLEKELKATIRVTDAELKDEYKKKRSEEHTSELQSHSDLVCRLLLEKKKKKQKHKVITHDEQHLNRTELECI